MRSVPLVELETQREVYDVRRSNDHSGTGRTLLQHLSYQSLSRSFTLATFPLSSHLEGRMTEPVSGTVMKDGGSLYVHRETIPYTLPVVAHK